MRWRKYNAGTLPDGSLKAGAEQAPAPTSHRGDGLVHKFRLAMMTGGVDFSGSPGGVTSATHGEAELDDPMKALRNTMRMLKQEGEI